MDNPRGNERGYFSIAVRVLGNEIVAFNISVDDIQTKWVVLGSILIASMTGVVATFGDEIKALIS